jgi:hypothetical protein
MSRLERISGRLPRLYQSVEKNSLILILLYSVNQQLNNAEEGITEVMKAHWVDTAKKEELDKMAILIGLKRTPDDDEAHLRGRLKRAVEDYKGGGTLSIILERVKELLSSDNKDDFEIIENPLVETSAEFSVVANDTWVLGSNSIEDEQPTLSLAVEGEGEVSNPQITNLDTGQFVTFAGKLEAGKQLVIKRNKALLGEEDVTKNVSPKQPLQLLRKESIWRYSEALSEMIGVFDAGKFDEHTFAVGIPTVRVRFDWVRRQPSTFLIQIKSNVLFNSGLTESYLERAVNSMKAAGVAAIIKVME